MTNNAYTGLKSKEIGEKFRKIPLCLVIWAINKRKERYLEYWMNLRIQNKKGFVGYPEGLPETKELAWLLKNGWCHKDKYGNIYLRSAERICRIIGEIKGRSVRYYYDKPFKEFLVAAGISFLCRMYRPSINGGGKLRSIHKGGISNSLIAELFNRSLAWACLWKYKCVKAGLVYTERRYFDTGIDSELLQEERRFLGEHKEYVIRDGTAQMCLSNYMEAGGIEWPRN